MNILKSIRAWVAGLITKKEPVMADPTPEVTTAPATTTDLDKLKALLLAVGHDIETEWDHLVALAQKVL